MTWVELEAEARKLADRNPKAVAERRAAIRQLIGTPQLPALLGELMAMERDFSQIAANPKAATDHGKLAHAAGGMYGAQQLLAQFRQILETKPKD
jgi:hypothetical protein